MVRIHVILFSLYFSIVSKFLLPTYTFIIQKLWKRLIRWLWSQAGTPNADSELWQPFACSLGFLWWSWASFLHGSPWGRGWGPAAGSQLCLETIPCPMGWGGGEGGLISELDRSQVLGTKLANQLPEAPVIHNSYSAFAQGFPLPTPVPGF